MNTQNTIRVTTLFCQGLAAQIAGLVNVLIFSFCILDVAPTKSIFYWVLAAFALTGLRYIVQKHFFLNIVNKKKAFSALLWENIFSFGAFLMGSLWGIASTVLLPENSVAHFAFLGFILAGNTAGAAVAYCTSIRATQAYLLPSVIPFAFQMIQNGEQIPRSMALLLGIYTILMSLTSRRMNRYVVDTLDMHSEKLRMITELNMTKAKVAESSKMAALGEMAGAIAHEINNPLAIIRGYSGILRKLASNEILDAKRTTELAEKIDSTTVRIAKIVIGLKMFSRDAGKDPLEQASIKTIISQTLEFCQTRFKTRGIPILYDEKCDDILVVCRSAQISQVLLNLLNNSFDAIQDAEKPWVQIDIRKDEDRIIVAVTDSGLGIPTEVQAKLMQPFFTTKKVGEGTGLGLSVAHGIMQGHGGALKLDTESHNTSFIMEFNRAA